MQQPDIITVPFARDAAGSLVNEIPNELPPGAARQDASWEQGFPFVTMQPPSSGGIPPNGQDFNGLFKALSEHIVYLNGGGHYKFSADFIAQNGGYQKGSTVISDDGVYIFYSNIDGNTENPNSSNPAGWTIIATAGANGAIQVSTVSDLFSLSLRIGSMVSTKGCTSIGDGGHGIFVCEQPSGTPDGYSRIAAPNGNHWVLQPEKSVSPRGFGAALDGVSDDTDAIIRCHVYANRINAAVFYDCVKFALDANARVPVNTSVDFNGAEIIILNGFVESPTFVNFNTLYIVSDPECPVITETGSVSPEYLVAGSVRPTAGIFDGHGYAEIECGRLIPNRTKTGTMRYIQAFKVNRLAVASHPLSVDLRDYASAITVRYRKTSKARITITGISCTTSPTWNHQRILQVERCNVDISNTTVLFDNPETFDDVSALIYIAMSSDISIRDFVTAGRPVVRTVGSYCLNIDGGADIYVTRMNALTGWGATGTNNISGVYYDYCVLNRVDAHSSGHNMFAANCAFHGSGIAYGWGGGIISVKNCTLYGPPAVVSRSDYGGYFYGEMVVDGITTSNPGTSLMRIIDLASNPVGASSMPVPSPYKITVRNVERVGTSTSLNNSLCPVDIMSLAGTVVTAPREISVIDIRGIEDWRFLLRLDNQNMEPYSANRHMRISISDVTPMGVVTNIEAGGLIEYPKTRDPALTIRPTITASNCDFFAIKLAPPDGGSITVENSNVTALIIDDTVTFKPRIVISGCRLSNQSVPGAPIGCSANGPGPTGYTVMRDCIISASNYDLSKVSVMSGCLIESGSTQPSLPTGATPETAFTGWKQGFSS